VSHRIDERTEGNIPTIAVLGSQAVQGCVAHFAFPFLSSQAPAN
jgi:hypothetical protein